MNEKNSETRRKLLDPKDCVLALVDYQAQMGFAVKSVDIPTLVNNVVGLAKTALVFDVPVVLSTVSEKSFSGPTFPALKQVLSGLTSIERSTMNPWEDENFRAAINKTGRKKIVLGGLWTEVCVCLPALSALNEDFSVYVVVDVCGGTSIETHNTSLQRMIQAGVIPLTWMQLALEYQRDWSRPTAAAVGGIMREHGGTFGIGIEYATAIMENENRT